MFWYFCVFMYWSERLKSCKQTHGRTRLLGSWRNQTEPNVDGSSFGLTSCQIRTFRIGFIRTTRADGGSSRDDPPSVTLRLSGSRTKRPGSDGLSGAGLEARSRRSRHHFPILRLFHVDSALQLGSWGKTDASSAAASPPAPSVPAFFSAPLPPSAPWAFFMAGLLTCDLCHALGCVYTTKQPESSLIMCRTAWECLLASSESSCESSSPDPRQVSAAITKLWFILCKTHLYCNPIKRQPQRARNHVCRVQDLTALAPRPRLHAGLCSSSAWWRPTTCNLAFTLTSFAWEQLCCPPPSWTN